MNMTNDFNEDEKIQIVTSILEDMTDNFSIICNVRGNIFIIGSDPNEMVSSLLYNHSSKVIYSPKKQYLNDRFDQIGWNHYTWN